MRYGYCGIIMSLRGEEYDVPMFGCVFSLMKCQSMKGF